MNLGWGDVNNVEIGLTDQNQMSAYPRFTWAADATASRYVITNFSGPTINRTVQGPRNYWHEGDWLYAGYYGVNSTSTVLLAVYKDQGLPFGTLITNVTLMTLSPVILATPAIATPQDATFKYALDPMQFTLDPKAGGYRLQIALATNLAPVMTVTNVVPFIDNNGVCQAPLPFYAGDNYVPTNGLYASNTWVNGRYWARVQAFTPATNSAWSTWSAFNLDLETPPAGGNCQITGEADYFGKVYRGFGPGQTNNLTIIVQAFQSPGFSGTPDGQVQISYVCKTNSPTPNKGAYNLMGLGNKTYYVRAFIDINGNRTLDPWEPVGFAKSGSLETDYQPLAVNLGGSAGVAATGIRVVIRDRDTDNDGLPDGWEWMYYGTLAKGAYDVGVSNLTYWGTTNITLIRCYQIDPLDIDPTVSDTDGDGVSDFDEVCYGDRMAGRAPDPAHYDPYDPVTHTNGTSLNPMKWDTDGDGLSDGWELAHGFNPLNPDTFGHGLGDLKEALNRGASIASLPGLPKVTHVAAVPPGGGVFSLKWTGQAGTAYQVQYSDDLKQWNDAANGQRYGAAEFEYIDQASGVATRY